MCATVKQENQARKDQALSDYDTQRLNVETRNKIKVEDSVHLLLQEEKHIKFCTNELEIRSEMINFPAKRDEALLASDNLD